MAKILVVDDDESIRKLISITLSSDEHEIFEAPDGEAALELIEQQSPHLMVLDVMMPNMDGWGVLREMKSRGLRGDCRVVMLTAKSAETDFVHGWRLGVDAYLTKPFEPDELQVVATETLMMTPEQLAQRRTKELERSHLLARLESAFRDE